MKVVIDTNVFVSGIFWKGAPHQVLKAWRHRKFQMVLSADILDEYRRVLGILNAGKSLVDIDELLEIVGMHSTVVEPVKLKQQVCSDADDDKFIAAAIAGHAKYVITGDKALLKVSRCSTVEMITPNTLLKLIT